MDADRASRADSLAAALKPRPRLDRDEVYIGVLFALLAGGVGILIAPDASKAIGVFADTTRLLLGSCVAVGSLLALIAASSAPPYAKRPQWLKKLVVPWWQMWHAYLMGFGGLFAVEIGLGYFTWAIYTSGPVVGTAMGAMAPILLVSCLLKSRRFAKEYRASLRDYELLRQHAISRGF